VLCAGDKSMKKVLMHAAVLAALSQPLCGFSAEPADIAELKQMVLEIKRQHERQIQALEQRIQQAESRAAQAEEQARAAEQKAVSPKPQAPSRQPAGDNGFNPAISMVLQGGIASYSADPEDFHIAGMPLGGEAGLHQEGPALWETELTASANVDNLFYGQTTIGLHNHEGQSEIDLEEAFVDTLALPAGLGLRFGRFYSATGYLNEHHTHAWDFADAPLSYQVFLGGQYRDDGLRASWVAPLDSLFLELGGEALRGDGYPGGGNAGAFGSVNNLFVKLGGDVGLHNSWQLGVSRLNVDVRERATAGHAHEHGGAGSAFSGDSDLTVVDAVWKTDLGGERALILQGEYFLRDESGRVAMTEDAGDAFFAYDGEQAGGYLQAVFQFSRQWRAGLRYDHLSADNALRMIANGTGEDDDDVLDESGYRSGGRDPHRWSLMADWTPSEFSRLRLQYARDDSREESDDQFFLQYIMTLGAHGAHRY
jgi:hypothetical protein